MIAIDPKDFFGRTFLKETEGDNVFEQDLYGLSLKKCDTFGTTYTCTSNSNLKNGIAKWQDSEETEMERLTEYKTFGDKGFRGETPAGFKKIRCHVIYYIKNDDQHESCSVDGGHLKDPTQEVFTQALYRFVELDLLHSLVN
jgi:hypothetical protein